MEQVLPILWEEFQVSGCGADIPGTQCFVPPDGPNTPVFANDPRGGVDFTGILPKQDPCTRDGEQTICSWTDLPSKLKQFVFGPITPSCIYSPGAGTGWVYPTPERTGLLARRAAAHLRKPERLEVRRHADQRLFH